MEQCSKHVIPPTVKAVLADQQAHGLGLDVMTGEVVPGGMVWVVR